MYNAWSLFPFPLYALDFGETKLRLVSMYFFFVSGP
jgi:hypothetical protein